MAEARNKFSITLIWFLLTALTLALYWPVHRFDFVNYDDPVYVTGNPQVKSGLTWEGARWAFSRTEASNWHPITWLSLMLDVQCFGLNSSAHHLVNALLHSINAGLLFLVLFRMTGALWPSAWTAALFAWHPLHVESVAWIAERKDVLSAFFFMLTLLAYAKYVSSAECPVAQGDKKSEVRIENPEYRIRHPESGGSVFDVRFWYCLSLAFFALGLMSKPMLVTAPFVLLLFDYWPLKRASLKASESGQWRRLVLEKIPFFGLALMSGTVTYLSQKRGGAVASLEYLSLGERLANAIVAYAVYLEKTFWPERLAVFYPHPAEWPTWQVLVCGLFLLATTSVVVWQARRRPYLAVGWFWYVGTLVPVIGLIQVGDQAYADRYSYLPLVGIFVAIAWSLREWVANSPRPQAAIGLTCGLLLALCMALTRQQLEFWKNGEALFRRALAVTANNYVAHNNLGNILSDAGKLEEAQAHYSAALTILPTYEDAHLNLGRLLIQQGDPERAVGHFKVGVRLKPNSTEGHYNLGVALATQGKYEEALDSYQMALSLKPNHTNAHYNLGIALTKLGRLEQAEHHYREALRLNPGFAFAHYNLALALDGLKRRPEAREHFARAAELDPSYLPAKNELGAVLLALEHYEEAAAVYRQVLQSQPHNAQAHNNLGLALARLREPWSAAAHFREVVRHEPNNADAHYNLANALADSGDSGEAARHYAEALRLNPQDQKAREKLERLQQKQSLFR